MDLSFFPPLNAALNGLAGVFLVLALVQIKRGDRRGHARSMVTALVVSAVFLASYVTFKALKGNVHTTFPEGYPLARRIYYPMLISHIILAVGMLPLIFLSVRRAVRGDFEGHRRMVRWAYPIWLYVSVTGVLVYFMLYQWFVPAADPAAPAGSAPLSAAAPGGPPAVTAAGDLAVPAARPGGRLAFEPLEFAHQAAEGEKEFTATFVATNTGTAPVTLTKLDSSCSCLKVAADVLSIPPGGRATIEAVFDIAKLAGESEKSVYVGTDIPGAGEIRLPVKVNVPPVVSLEPNMVTWAVGSEPAPREAVFRVLREKPIRVLEAGSSREGVTAELRTVTEGREYRIVLTPRSTDAVMLGLVRIKTDCELEEHRHHLLYFAVQDPATTKGG